MNRLVSWLRTEFLHLFLEVIGESESTQEVIGWGSGSRLSVVFKSTQEAFRVKLIVYKYQLTLLKYNAREQKQDLRTNTTCRGNAPVLAPILRQI
jgi:hypothetical protein